MRVVATNTTTPRLRALAAIPANRTEILSWGYSYDMLLGEPRWVVRADNGAIVEVIEASAFAAKYTEVTDEVADPNAAKSSAAAKLLGLTFTAEEATALAGAVPSGTPGILGSDGASKWRIGVEPSGTVISEQMDP